MSTMLKLNLDEVQSLLGLSTDSILNHIDKGTLTAGKLKNKGENIYVFEFTEVKDFAKEYLDMSVDLPEVNDTLFDDEDNEEEEEEEEIVAQVKNKKKTTKKKAVDSSSGVAKILANLQKSYESALKQMTDYKEQAAFRIGQLEGELSSQKNLLSSGQQELSEKELMIKRLKIELKKTRINLEQEKTSLDRMSLWDRILKKKK